MERGSSDTTLPSPAAMYVGKVTVYINQERMELASVDKSRLMYDLP